MTLILAAADGAIAADPGGDDSIAAAALSAPVSLAGRWTGLRHAFGARKTGEGCENGRCTLTLDIISCGTDWCGIAVGKDGECGAQAMRLTRSAKPERSNVFEGKLELAKGSDPYVVEAWYSPPIAVEGDAISAPSLSLIGDTGPELMLFRRSFPFSADLARTGDANCSIEKATS